MLSSLFWKNTINLLKTACVPEPEVLIKYLYIEDRFLQQIFLDAADPAQFNGAELMGFLQLVHSLTNPGFVADEGGANGIPPDQADDVGGDLLIGEFGNSGVQLLGGKALPIQRQAQIPAGSPGSALWAGCRQCSAPQPH